MFSRIEVTGNDASSFLQAQLTQNLKAVSATHSPLAAWCDPKGRVIATMRLLLAPDGIGIVLPTSMADAVIAGLSRYRLRADVEFQPAAGDWVGLAIANERDLSLLDAKDYRPQGRRDASVQRAGITCVNLAASGRVVEIYGMRADLDAAGLEPATPLSPDHWHAARIAAGIVDIVPATSARYTPHMLNLDQLGAVSFDKGCYPGQEIVARTQHLGSSRRRAAHFHSSAPLAIGSKVDLDGTSVGDVLAAAGSDAMLLLPMDLHAETLRAQNATLTPAGSP